MMARTMRDIQRQNAAIGNYFFSAGAMRFFNSRIHDEVYGDAFFVTSERYEEEPRRYTVRFADAEGYIHDVSGFQAFATRGGAHAAAQRWAKLHEEGRAVWDGTTLKEVE